MEKEVLKSISYGMYLVTSKQEDKKVGCIINTLEQLTSKNPLISICLNKENETTKKIQETKKFVVSILSEKVDPNLIAKFGFSSSKDTDKFADFPNQEVDNLPVIETGMCGYLVCEVKEIIDCETHNLIIARVVSSKKITNEIPMTYRYYQEVIKGKSPRKAPTYIEEEKKNVWVCDVCGYTYEGDLPEGFICPICGVDETHFQKQ